MTCNMREPFSVTDDMDDAPDGAVVFLGRRGWYERSGRTWWPINRTRARAVVEEMARDLAAPSPSADAANPKSKE